MEPELIAPRPRPPWLPLATFAATVLTTLLAGSMYVDLPARAGLGERLLGGLPFAAAVLAILGSHELGHLLLARAHGVESSGPFFIPGPWSLGGAPGFGTFGAVIRLRSAIPGRRALLDIGAAGPVAGFAVAVPLLAWGLAHSAVRPVGDAWLEGSGPASPVGLLLAWLRGEAGHPGPGVYGDSLVTWAVQRLVVGRLSPHQELFVHPVALAAWLGLFVTTLNLLPIGQLDGGHVLYALLGGRRALRASRLLSWALLAAGLFLSWNWLVWWAITRFFVRLGHPPALDDRPLDRPRVALALLCFLLFAVTFIPVPVSM